MKTLLLMLAMSLIFLSAMAQSWTDLNAPIGGNTFAFERLGTNIYGTTSVGGFIKSTDGGQHWTSDTAGIPKGTPTMLGVTGSGKILMAKMDIGGANGNFPFYASTDAGATWSPVTGNAPAGAGSLVTGTGNKILYIPTYNGFSTMKVSSDGGQTWNNTSLVAKSGVIASNGDIYVLNYHAGSGSTQLSKSTSNDSTFSALPATGMQAMSEKITMAANSKIYVAGGSGKPTVSSDNGSNFTAMDSNYGNIWPDANNNLFCTVGTSVVYRIDQATGALENVSTGIGPFGISGFYAHANGSVYITSGIKVLKYGGSSPTALNELLSNDLRVDLYPNPSQNFINLNFDGGATMLDGQLYIYNQLGEKVLATKITGKKMTIDTGSLPKGPYFIYIIKDETNRSLKIIKE